MILTKFLPRDQKSYWKGQDRTLNIEIGRAARAAFTETGVPQLICRTRRTIGIRMKQLSDLRS